MPHLFKLRDGTLKGYRVIPGFNKLDIPRDIRGAQLVSEFVKQKTSS